MKLHQFSFTQLEFQRLPESEQRLFAALAHARNDIRHLNFMLIASSQAVGLPMGQEERTIALHHYQHILRLLASTLHEVWKIIKKGWHGCKIGQSAYRELTIDGQLALRDLGKYFGDGSNNLRRIRDSVGFHYDLDSTSRWFKFLPEETNHQILSGDLSQNIFHLFPEVALNHSIFGISGTDNQATVEAKVHRVGGDILRVLDLVTSFSDSYFMAVMKRLKYRTRSLEVSDGIDPRACATVVIAANP